MKRSEMIQIISKRLGPLGISEPTCEEVLTLLEEAGMKPPRNSKMYHPSYHDDPFTYMDDLIDWDEEQ
jgi:hypothetical protein